MITAWIIGEPAAPMLTLSQLQSRYTRAVAWEARTHATLDQARMAYARMLLAGESGNKIQLRARQRLWRRAGRDMQRAERALTGRLLQAQPAEQGEC